MNEAETRAEHIDPALKAAGWGVVEGSRIRREYPITLGRLEGSGRRGKKLEADYVLEYRNRRLAVVEAKAWDEALTEGVAQAKNYAGKLAVRFTYATNGKGIYGIDMQTGTEGEQPAYPTPDELWKLTFAKQDKWRDRFTDVAFEDKGGSHPTRYYQDNAIDEAMKAIAAGSAAHPVNARDGDREDVHCVSDCVEAVPEPVELERGADPASTHPVPGGSEHSRESGVQCVLGVPGRCDGADHAGGYSEEGEGAEECQYLLHDLPDVYD